MLHVDEEGVDEGGVEEGHEDGNDGVRNEDDEATQGEEGHDEHKDDVVDEESAKRQW